MEQTNFWSPSTVFNRFGSLRCEDEYRSSSGWRMALTCATEKIAKCIEQLGYVVACGYGGSGGWIIQSIHKHSSKALPGGKLVYGIMNSRSYISAQEKRSLSGNRTIYEAAKAFCPEKFTGDYSNLRLSIDCVFTEKKIKDLIEKGSHSNQISKVPELMETYLQGVSTIGNTLPADIVEALRTFTSTDGLFAKDPDYEFYIPPSMQELPEACPCPEEPHKKPSPIDYLGVCVAPSQDPNEDESSATDSDSD